MKNVMSCDCRLTGRKIAKGEWIPVIMPSHEAWVIFTLSDTIMENTKSKEITVQQKPQMETAV